MNAKTIGIILIALYAMVLVATLSDYGMNEDNPGHFLRGQAYLELFLTGKRSIDQPQRTSPIMFIPGQRISLYKLSAYESNLSPIRPIAGASGALTEQQAFRSYQEKFGRSTYYKHDAWNAAHHMAADGPGHPAVSSILAAVTNRLLYEKLAVLPDIEAYHLYIVATSLVALLVVFFFTLSVWGEGTAFGALFSLALFPFFFAESHFNIKDIPELAFFTATLVFFSLWVHRGKAIWLVLFAIGLFLATGTKLNAVFIPIILFLWLVFTRKSTAVRLGVLCIACIIVVVGVIGSWPWLWDAPFLKLLQTLEFYRNVGSTDTRLEAAGGFLGPFGINFEGIALLIFTMPVPMIVMVILGLVAIIKSKHKDLSFLVIVWLIVILARVMRPGAAVFGSIRQFAEVLPSLAILAGIGIGKIGETIKLRWAKVGILAVYAALLMFPLVQYHPNQNVFFNEIIGGPTGALRRGLYAWETSYDNPYRQAINWLNQNTASHAKLAYLDGTMLAISPLWLRDDIVFGSSFSGFNQHGEYVISIVYPDPPSVFAYRYLERFLTPIHEISVGGIATARIWRNSPEYVKEEYRKIESLHTLPTTRRAVDSRLGPYWEIDLGVPRQIVSVSLNTPGKCVEREGFVTIDGTPSVPMRTSSGDTLTLLFPAETGQMLRVYGLGQDSCVLLGDIGEITLISGSQ